MNNYELEEIQPLVGENIKREDLKGIDYHISQKFGVFVSEDTCCLDPVRLNHAHPAYSFMIFLDPEVAFFEESIDLPDSHYLGALIGPNVPHVEEIKGNIANYMVVFIEKQLFESCFHSISKKKFSIYRGFELFPVPESVVKELNRFRIEDEKKASSRKKEMFAEAITLQLVRAYTKEEVCPKTVVTVFDIGGIIEYMNQNFHKPVYMYELARKAGVSKDHFNRWFKKETGRTPLDYLVHIRLSKSKELLESTQESITNIAEACGFSNIGHFSTSFKEHFQITPSAFRKQYRK